MIDTLLKQLKINYEIVDEKGYEIDSARDLLNLQQENKERISEVIEEVAFDIRSKRNTRLRVATKYPNLTNDFLISKGVTQYKLISSLGATETYPFIGSSEIITDITSTGKTLVDNNLRVLKDGLILKSTACLFVAKKRTYDTKNFFKCMI